MLNELSKEELIKMLSTLRADRERLREALRFYAKKENYYDMPQAIGSNPVAVFGIEKANQALQESENTGDK